MHFCVHRDVLLKPLQMVGGVIDRKHAVPVLSNVLLELNDTGLTLTGTDMEVTLVVHVPVTDAPLSGAVTLQSRKLLDIARALPEGAILDCRLQDNKFLISAGCSKFSLTVMSASDFPVLPESLSTAQFQLSAEVLRQLISKTSFSMAQQDVRYYLNGMSFTFFQDHIRAVATDGHRLATFMIQTDPMPVREPLTLILPRKGVLELSKLLQEQAADIDVHLTKNHLCINAGSYAFTSKLIEGSFPDYRQVLPEKNEKIAVLPTRILREALQRVSVLLLDKNRGASFKFSSNQLLITTLNVDKDEGEEFIEVDYQANDIEIGLNVNYLLEFLLNAGGDAVNFTFTDNNASVLIEEAAEQKQQWKYVIMPMLL